MAAGVTSAAADREADRETTWADNPSGYVPSRISAIVLATQRIVRSLAFLVPAD